MAQNKKVTVYKSKKKIFEQPETTSDIEDAQSQGMKFTSKDTVKTKVSTVKSSSEDDFGSVKKRMLSSGSACVDRNLKKITSQSNKEKVHVEAKITKENKFNIRLSCETVTNGKVKKTNANNQSDLSKDKHDSTEVTLTPKSASKTNRKSTDDTSGIYSPGSNRKGANNNKIIPNFFNTTQKGMALSASLCIYFLDSIGTKSQNGNKSMESMVSTLLDEFVSGNTDMDESLHYDENTVNSCTTQNTADSASDFSCALSGRLSTLYGNIL